MPREPIGYRENLQDILEFFDGKRLLNISDVGRYLGLKRNSAIKSMFPFRGHYISAATLAKCLSDWGDAE